MVIAYSFGAGTKSCFTRMGIPYASRRERAGQGPRAGRPGTREGERNLSLRVRGTGQRSSVPGGQMMSATIADRSPPHIFLVSHDGHFSGAATHVVRPRRWPRSSVRSCTCSMLHLTATEAGAVSLLREQPGVLRSLQCSAVSPSCRCLWDCASDRRRRAETTWSARLTRARSPVGEAPGFAIY